VIQKDHFETQCGGLPTHAIAFPDNEIGHSRDMRGGSGDVRRRTGQQCSGGATP
jgi:hypothetical protein